MEHVYALSWKVPITKSVLIIARSQGEITKIIIIEQRLDVSIKSIKSVVKAGLPDNY